VKLAVAGAGGHGRVVAEIAAQRGWEVVFFDDAPAGGRVLGYDVGGPIELLLRTALSFDGFIVAIGDNETRLDWSLRLQEAGGRPQSLVHPSAHVSEHASVGTGSVIMPKAVVMTSARLGLYGIVNTSASVDHDCVLGDGVHIAPGARLCGGVAVGALTLVGVGAVIIGGISIGARTVVGAGSVVIRDIADNAKVAGNPARPIGRH
jgi:sugar O-acyltransferase (sialic acid O-acetyltransferase NeuD family)